MTGVGRSGGIAGSIRNLTSSNLLARDGLVGVAGQVSLLGSVFLRAAVEYNAEPCPTEMSFSVDLKS